MSEEKDPTGRSAEEGGAKLDAGKPRLGLVLGGFANALIEVGKVGTLGAAKYSDNGWMTVPNAKERYTDAELRHCLKRLAGEIYDPEWGLLHLAHNAWNSLALLELELRKLKEANPKKEGGEITMAKKAAPKAPAKKAAPCKGGKCAPAAPMAMAAAKGGCKRK
jgi:hypothetical protein